MKITVKDVDKGWASLVKIRGQRGAARSGVVGAKASQSRKGGLTNGQLAMIHEFGSADGHIPERSFLRAAFDANREKYLRHLEKLCRAVYERKLTIKQALGILGEEAASDVRTLIRSSIPPPNSPATIARKGSSTTLIDSGQMLGSIQGVVSMGEREEEE